MSETPMQKDMFTGKLVDTRSSHRKKLDKEQNQPKQMQMFSAAQTVRLGETARPWLNDLTSGTLVLESEDHRTPEEIERDLMREAEKHTNPMFPGEMAVTDNLTDKTDTLPAELDSDVSDGELSKQTAYLTLVQISQEKQTTLWVDAVYRQAFARQLPLAVMAAHHVGLTDTEMMAAMQIGEFLGQKEKRETGYRNKDVVQTDEKENSTVAGGQDAASKGFRLRVRQASVAARGR